MKPLEQNKMPCGFNHGPANTRRHPVLKVEYRRVFENVVVTVWYRILTYFHCTWQNVRVMVKSSAPHANYTIEFIIKRKHFVILQDNKIPRKLLGFPAIPLMSSCRSSTYVGWCQLDYNFCWFLELFDTFLIYFNQHPQSYQVSRITEQFVHRFFITSVHVLSGSRQWHHRVIKVTKYWSL